MTIFSLQLMLLLIFVRSSPAAAAFVTLVRSITPSIRTFPTSLPLTSNGDNSYLSPPSKRTPQGGDMAYIQKNIQRQMNTYQAIRDVGGSEAIVDVYAQSPLLPNQFWYIGKLARTTGTVTLQDAVLRQLVMMEEHASRLRPIELGRSFGKLQFWVAPGDSELGCSEGRVELVRVDRHAGYDSSSRPSLKEVGFLPEVVTNQGVGFCIERNPDGTCIGK
jgi:hypothetical protein